MQLIRVLTGTAERTPGMGNEDLQYSSRPVSNRTYSAEIPRLKRPAKGSATATSRIIAYLGAVTLDYHST